MYVWGAICDTDHETQSIQDPARVLRYPIRHPTFPPMGEVVTAFSVGQKHVVAVVGGIAYGMGCNTAKQLGKLLPPFTETFRPIGFSSQSPVAQVACGYKHTMIRTEDGNVYTCGDNTFRQLGHTSRAAGWNPVPVAHVKHIATGGNSCYAVTTRGEVYSWGSVRQGALGHGTRGEKERMKAGAEEYEDVAQPTLIEWFNSKRVKILELSAAKEHFVCRSETDVFVCGDGSFGKLGLGDNQESLEPTRLTFPERKYKERLVSVSAGGDQTVVLKESSEFGSIIYVCGRIGNSHDRYLTPEIMTIPGAGTLSKVFAGVMHCYAVSSAGVVYGWGQSIPANALGVSGAATRSVPSPVAGLNDGKFIIDIQSSPFLVVATADDAKRDPAATPLEVVLPHADRRSSYRIAKDSTYDYDAARRATLAMILSGADNADAYIATLQQPAAEELALEYELKRVGAHGLQVGSKVRVWMTDVYALGKVTARDIPQRPANHFEIAWARDDWDDEIVELRSEDETLDEENADRWQNLWFIGDGGEGSL